MGEDLGSMLECGGQRTVYGKGMGVNIWGIDTKDTFGFSILWNPKKFTVYFPFLKDENKIRMFDIITMLFR